MMGSLGAGRINGDWMSRVIKLESEVNNWRIKFEIQSLWRKVVEEWMFDEFGFDVSRQVQKLEKDFRKANVVDVTFSTKNVEVNFTKLREALSKQPGESAKVSGEEIRNDLNQGSSSPQFTLKSLPSSISVTEVKSALSEGYDNLVGVSIEPLVDEEQSLSDLRNSGAASESAEEEHQEIELIEPEKEPSYEFPSIPGEENGDLDPVSDDIIEIDVDAADRTEFPLTIYDLEEDEEEAITSGDQPQDDMITSKVNPDETSILAAASFETSLGYQAEGIEFTTVESLSDTNDDNQYPDQEDGDDDYPGPDELDLDPCSLVAVTHDTDGDTRKRDRPYRARPARSLIQTLIIPGEKRKFQCLACQRIFSDRGNGHRHVRRMHPGQSVQAQKQFGAAGCDELNRFSSSPDDPPIPILIPEVSLGELPNRSHVHTSFSDTSCPDLTRTYKGDDSNSPSSRRGLNIKLPSGIDIQALAELEGLPVEDEDDDDDNEFEDEDESFMLRDHSQSAVPISVIVPGNFGEQHPTLQGRLTVEQRREAAKLIRKVQDNQFKCIQCNRFFSVSCNARRHARVVHFGERLYECHICQKRFSSKTDGIVHEKYCVDKHETQLSTIQSKETFPVASSSSARGKVVSRGRRIPSTVGRVRDKTHLPIRRLRRSYGRNGKTVHVPPNVLSTGLITKKVNGKTVYYECKVCRNRYADLRSAWSHAKRMHLTEKPHKCTNCPKSYFNRKDFLKHQLKCCPIDNTIEDKELEYAERMQLDPNIVQMMEVDPGSLSGAGSDQDQESPDLRHFLEISEVDEDTFGNSVE